MRLPVQWGWGQGRKESEEKAPGRGEGWGWVGVSCGRVLGWEGGVAWAGEEALLLCEKWGLEGGSRRGPGASGLSA